MTLELNSFLESVYRIQILSLFFLTGAVIWTYTVNVNWNAACTVENDGNPSCSDTDSI